ncbi:MAG TPA: oxygenase MpaB family protein [Planctomycetota bacterium]|nr:oxygenase MpaB family protein [Planctomycetota bacterium]
MPPSVKPTAKPWTDAELDAMRQIGDVEVDPMAEAVISGAVFDQVHGRLGYHNLLGLADVLLQSLELMLLKDSMVATSMANMPKAFVDYFDPMVVPEWVDQAKLDRASELWNENMIAIIGVLYACSLPSCYLIAKGIPTLYDTGKLGQHRFIYQRIYETGLMLDAVMEPGGLHIITDITDANGAGGQRYVWGRGFIAARKVRLLHASMRCMLLHPERMLPKDAHASVTFANSSIGALTTGILQKPYDVASLGKPVNQEDLAYTLLTFGYAIPVGLRAWGCRLSDADCDAFLHVWRLVGHLMGVCPDLIPADFAQAKAFYEKVKSRQAGPSAQGPKLMRSLTMFLQDYLPPCLMRDLPLMLVATQLSKQEVADIRPPGTRTPSLGMRVLVGSGFTFLKLYY